MVVLEIHMMRRSNPFDFSDFESMFERMNRQFSEMNRQLNSWDADSHTESRHGMHGMHGMQGMAIDMSEQDNDIVVVADLPGFEKADIDLKIAGKMLTIVAEREMESESDDSSEYIRRERRSHAVRRSLQLPVEVDEEGASATYTNGVLSITLPKIDVEDDDDAHHIDVN